jgi:tetratricopeptide (TPR) repeat protein
MVIIVSVVAKKTFAVSVRVEHVCDKSDRVFRNIKNLSIYGSIETSELMDKAPDSTAPDVLRTLKPGDHLKAAIKEIDLTEGKLLLTLRKSQVNISLSQRHHRLGPLDSQLALAEMARPISPTPYEEDLQHDIMFRNPGAVETMAAAYGLDLHGSFVLAQPSGPYYDDLRRVQNRAWAQEIVAQGIQHAKREDYKTAMKHYSHALHFDPDNRDAHVARGACFYNINMLEDAEKEFQEALRIDPNDPNAQRYMSSTKEKLKQQQRENEDAHISSISGSIASSRKPNPYVPTPQISLPTPPASSMPIASSQGIATSTDQALHMLGVTTSTEKLKELLKMEERRRRTKEKEKSRDKTKKRKEKHKKRKREKDKDKTGDRDKGRSREHHRSRESRRSRRKSKESRSGSPNSDASSESSDSRSTPKRPRRSSPSPDGPRV